MHSIILHFAQQSAYLHSLYFFTSAFILGIIWQQQQASLEVIVCAELIAGIIAHKYQKTSIALSLFLCFFAGALRYSFYTHNYFKTVKNVGEQSTIIATVEDCETSSNKKFPY